MSLPPPLSRKSIEVDRRLELPRLGRPTSVGREATSRDSSGWQSSHASFEKKARSRQQRQRKRARSQGSRLRLVVYGLLGLTLWIVFGPSTSHVLTQREKSHLISAADVAAITKSFVPEFGHETYEKQTLILGSESLLYEYDSTTPNQPRIASLIERRSGVMESLSETPIFELLGDFSWKSEPTSQSGLLPMEGGRQLGDESESYFLFENNQAVGNLITVRIGSSRLSLIVSGIVLLNEDEIERLLRPVLERLAHSSDS